MGERVNPGGIANGSSEGNLKAQGDESPWASKGGKKKSAYCQKSHNPSTLGIKRDAGTHYKKRKKGRGGKESVSIREILQRAPGDSDETKQEKTTRLEKRR